MATDVISSGISASHILLGVLGVLIVAIVVFLVRAESKAVKATTERDAEQARADRVAADQALAKKQVEDFGAFLKRARHLPARIAFSCFSGEQVNLLPVLDVEVEIEAPEGAYKVSLRKTVEPQKAHHYETGNKLQVYVDPDDKNHIELDFSDD